MEECKHSSSQQKQNLSKFKKTNNEFEFSRDRREQWEG